MAPDLPEQLLHWQPQIRYLLLDERRYAEAELVGLRNVAAALFRLENSRSPADVERVLASLVEWLGAPEQAALRRAFVVWLKRVLLPARIPGADIPHITELQEMQIMLAERIKTWTEQWKREGLEQGLEQGIKQGIQRGEAMVLRRQMTRRFGPLPEWVDQRLEQASTTQLEAWADRVLDCQTLGEVFGEST